MKHVKGKGHHAEHTIVFMLMYVYTSLVAEDVKLIGRRGARLLARLLFGNPFLLTFAYIRKPTVRLKNP